MSFADFKQVSQLKQIKYITKIQRRPFLYILFMKYFLLLSTLFIISKKLAWHDFFSSLSKSNSILLNYYFQNFFGNLDRNSFMQFTSAINIFAAEYLYFFIIKTRPEDLVVPHPFGWLFCPNLDYFRPYKNQVEPGYKGHHIEFMVIFFWPFTTIWDHWIQF